MPAVAPGPPGRRGQTETTAQIGDPPGAALKPGSMGRALPGYVVELVDPVTGEPAGEGEICLDLAHPPLAPMVGYRDDDERAAEAMRAGYCHTGDVAARDADGYITYVISFPRRSAARSAASSCARARRPTSSGGWSEADFPELKA